MYNPLSTFMSNSSQPSTSQIIHPRHQLSFTPAQQILLHQQQKKQDQLKQQKSQLQLNLIELKQFAKTFQQLYDNLKAQPDLQQHKYLMLENGQKLLDSIDRLKTISESLLSQQNQTLSNIHETLNFQYQNLQQQFRLSEYQCRLSDSQALINMYEHQAASKRQQIQQIEKKIEILQGPNLQIHINQFIDQIQNQFPNDISQEEIETLRRFDFGALKINILTQISHNKSTLSELQEPILSQRYKILSLQQQVHDFSQLSEQLESNQQLRAKNQQQINELKAFNSYLEENFESEVDKQVEERRVRLNDLHLKETTKYIRAGEYLLMGFEKLLGEEKFKELNDKLYELKEEAAEKALSQRRDAGWEQEN